MRPEPAQKTKIISAFVSDAAPNLAAAIAFLAGAATIISAANPSAHPRTADAVALIAVEAPSMIAALVGVAQMALAIGLRRRVDASMWTASALAVIAAIYFVFHHERYFDAAFQISFAFFLFAVRRAFYRRARAFSLRLPLAWFAGAGAALIAGAFAAVLWAATHPAFRTAPFHSLFTDPVIGRGARPVATAFAAVGVIAIWRYIAGIHRPPPETANPDDFSRIGAVLQKAEGARPETMLSYSGEFAFLFSPGGASFIPFVAFGGSLISLGGPSGLKSERRALITAFCAHADAQGLKPVIYSAPVELLPDLLDLGLKIEKIGENAVIPLADFSLAGKARESIRYASRKLTRRDGAKFEIHAPPHSASLIEELRPVSDAWLAMHKTGEKRFSLGRFEPSFLDHCPIAVARVKGAAVAFGTILQTPDGVWAALDLMRYAPDEAPPSTMDFLLAEILLWAKGAGYEKFDLSMAPLSGLAEERQAPLFARLGRLIYEQGGRWYNFDGLRKFKDKFKPEWEPRYLVTKGALSLPVALAQIAMLTNSPPPGSAPD
ncbi:MAG: DUF2156 domain-containing protein [Parvularculaceae bacterium]|nr:DUF2156 domain-containing protein [Parvularculaceae bacterium]